MTQILKLSIVAALLCGSSLLAACNTVEGAGKDIEHAGEKVQDANCASNDPSCKK